MAQQLALDYPFVAASLTLVGTFCDIPSEFADAARAAFDFIEAHDMATVASARITNAFSDAVNPVMRGYFIERVAGNDKRTYTHAARAIAAFSSADRLGEIDVPTLVVVGEDDRVTPPPLSETLAARIGGARLSRIASAGHICNLEQPAVFNQALLQFLEGL